jgi:hypothetical protein
MITFYKNFNLDEEYIRGSIGFNGFTISCVEKNLDLISKLQDDETTETHLTSYKFTLCVKKKSLIRCELHNMLPGAKGENFIIEYAFFYKKKPILIPASDLSKKKHFSISINNRKVIITGENIIIEDTLNKNSHIYWISEHFNNYYYISQTNIRCDKILEKLGIHLVSDLYYKHVKKEKSIYPIIIYNDKQTILIPHIDMNQLYIMDNKKNKIEMIETIKKYRNKLKSNFEIIDKSEKPVFYFINEIYFIKNQIANIIPKCILHFFADSKKTL